MCCMHSMGILMCRKREHGKDRLKPAEARKFLEKYLGKINTAISDTSLIYALNFNYQVISVCYLPIPANPVPEHSFYLMQWLRIGGNNHLIFFDREANAHLVQGKMALAAGF